MTLSPNRRRTSWPALRRAGLAFSLGLVALTLAACGNQNLPPTAGGGQASAPTTTLPSPPPVATLPPGPLPSPGAPIRIGLLLPLTGNNAALGQGMLQAAQMALFEVGGDDVALIVRDTEVAPGGAAEAARSAIADGVQLILGPIYASATKEVAPIALAAKVSVISFSTDSGAAGNGAFIMGVLPQIQVDRVVGYASSQGIRRYGALAPSSPYGNRMVEALKAAAARFGGQVVAAEFYEPGSKDPSAPVKALAKVVNAPGDAVMLPEGGDRLRILAPLLPYYDIDPAKVRLLGTSLWDDPNLGNEPALVGGWYAAPPADSWAAFAQRYRAAYNLPPPRIASLAYDATTLALALAKQGANFSVAALTQPSGFSGVDGIFRFTDSGLVERGLAVYELQKGGATQIDPAPQSFDALTQ